MNAANFPPRNVFLADDDPDDRFLFEEALKEINDDTNVTMAYDGEHLMSILDTQASPHPEMIFLDLNMPRKNGFECLQEIRQKEKYNDIPVVVFSTSCQQDAIRQMYALGASYYICKPDSFQKLIKSINKIFSMNMNGTSGKRGMDDFVIAF